MLGLVYVKNRVQFRELEEFGDLGSGIAELQRAPRLSLSAFALRAWIPVSIVILEYGGAAFGADHLSDGALCHDQLTEATAIDVAHVLQVEEYLVVALGDFVADGLPEQHNRVACSNLSGKVDDTHAVDLPRR